MIRSKILIIMVLALTVVTKAEKKIELQDIEEDNLKSEKQTQSENTQDGISGNMIPLEFLKSNFFRHFQQNNQPHTPRYVHQYAVNEQQESVKPTHDPSRVMFQPSGQQQAMVGYMSNFPMQIYLVPQYYNDQGENGNSAPSGVQFTGPGAEASHSPPRATYPTPEAPSSPTNYLQVPQYEAPTGKSYSPSGPQHITYVINPQPTAPSPGQFSLVSGPEALGHAAPQIFYKVPMAQYHTALVAPPLYPKEYYPQYLHTNGVEDHQNEVEQEKYSTQSEAPYTKSISQEYLRHYPTKASLREEQRHSSVSELPSPNPLLLRSPPSHLSHLPKALPVYRPLKPVYSNGGLIPNALTPRPNDAYGAPYKSKPSSLLDSYIPSSVQLEYLKRGYAKDPLSVYDVLSNSRHNYQHTVTPRQYERGFLPNQMYHTAAGGVTFGHYKRGIKSDKFVRNQ